MTEEIAVGWRPEEGETIKGKVTDLTSGWSDQSGTSYPIVVLKTEDGKLVNVHCFHYTLKMRLVARRPKIGDRVEITYHGKKPTKDGRRTVAIYSVDTPDTVVDSKSFWDDMDDTKAATPEPESKPEPEEQEELPF